MYKAEQLIDQLSLNPQGLSVTDLQSKLNVTASGVYSCINAIRRKFKQQNIKDKIVTIPNPNLNPTSKERLYIISKSKHSPENSLVIHKPVIKSLKEIPSLPNLPNPQSILDMPDALKNDYFEYLQKAIFYTKVANSVVESYTLTRQLKEQSL